VARLTRVEMDNLVVHINLPKGLKLADGRTLMTDYTLTVVGTITPFYCSIDQVRLAGGVYLNKVSDMTIASMIYEKSKDADSFSYTLTAPPTVAYTSTNQAWRTYNLKLNARQNWVKWMTALQLILNVYELSGARGSHTLANLSVQRQSITRDEGMPKKISDLQKQADAWLITLKSGGVIGPGGHVRPAFAAKGIYDPSDAPPGRLWVTTGMGANERAVPGFGSSGKPFRYASPPIVSWRKGRYEGAYVAVVDKASVC
jgi:hypothetical protein